MSVFSIANILPVSSLLLIVTSITLWLANFYKRKYSYWAKRGVPYLKPVLFFGNTKNQLLQRVPMAIDFQRFYNELDGNKFGGIFVMTTPNLFLRDPEIIRTFLIKSFSNFHDRPRYINEKLDPLSAGLLSLTGQRWRNVRYKLTYPFSSGKLRLMQDLMNKCTNELDEYLTKATSKNAAGSEQNLKKLMSKLTTDVIGSCTLGLQCNAIRDENSEFYQIGRKVFQFSYRVVFRNILKPVFPKLIEVFNLKVFSQDVDDFFLSALHSAVKEREVNANKRNDFLQTLINMQAEEQEQLRSNGHSQQNGNSTKSIPKDDASEGTDGKSSVPLFTDNVVASNAFLFFLAGFETTASTLTFILYELTLNPDVFDKIRSEVESVKEAHGGHLDYNALKELVYMDMVISESMRKYPAVFFTRRICTETFKIPESPVIIEKGMPVIVPIYALHHDPKYFPEPDKFIPERFSKENKDSIVPGSYLPFGDGPRNCIGSRFALFEIKETLSLIVSNYTLHLSEKTQVPVKFNVAAGILTPEDGIWIKFRKRDAA